MDKSHYVIHTPITTAFIKILLLVDQANILALWRVNSKCLEILSLMNILIMPPYPQEILRKYCTIRKSLCSRELIAHTQERKLERDL